MELIRAFEVVSEALRSRRLLVVVGNCRVKYFGRAASKLAEGDRLVIVKSDGSFLVHQDKGMAAVNYQPPRGLVSCRLEDGCLVLRAERREPTECLEAVFSRVDFTQAFGLKDDSTLTVFGTEKNLAELLMQDLECIEPGLVPLKQESETLKGYIDVFARDREGNLVLIEVKRRPATLDAVSQLKRYVEETRKRKDASVRGILAAPSISQNALAFLEKEGLEFVKLDYEVSNPSARIRGVQRKQKELIEFG